MSLGLQDYRFTVPANSHIGPLGMVGTRLFVKEQARALNYTFIQNEIGDKTGGQFTTQLLKGSRVSFTAQFDQVLVENKTGVDIAVICTVGDGDYQRNAGGSYVGAADFLGSFTYAVNGAAFPATPFQLLGSNPKRRSLHVGFYNDGGLTFGPGLGWLEFSALNPQSTTFNGAAFGDIGKRLYPFDVGAGFFFGYEYTFHTQDELWLINDGGFTGGNGTVRITEESFA